MMMMTTTARIMTESRDASQEKNDVSKTTSYTGWVAGRHCLVIIIIIIIIVYNAVAANNRSLTLPVNACFSSCSASGA